MDEMRNKIYADFDENTVCVYQAFCHNIADFAVKNNRMGGGFGYKRMSWIKTSFLWMMYRSGWATKPDQERVLAIYIKREAFETLLEKAVLSAYSAEIYPKKNDWKLKMLSSDVRVQWDPDKDVNGKNTERRAIQLGIRGETLKAYAADFIERIEDITEYVHLKKKRLDEGILDISSLPKETEYPYYKPIG